MIALPMILQGLALIDRLKRQSVSGHVDGDEPRASHTCGIAFMAKASAPGRAKTRLVPPLTFEQAAALNTAFLQDVAENLMLADEAARAIKSPVTKLSIVGYAAYGPPGATDFFRRILPAATGLIEAWLPNFGDCLFHTIGEILSRGHQSAVVLNSDSPTLPTAFLVETTEALARPGDRAVLGPSTDGGYYLLGLKQAHARLFEDISWSTERVEEQTLARAREIGLAVHILPTWYDVDDVEALQRLEAEFSYPSPQGGAEHANDPLHLPRYAAHTAKLIRQLARDRELGRTDARPAAPDQAHA